VDAPDASIVKLRIALEAWTFDQSRLRPLARAGRKGRTRRQYPARGF
jgi:hypothetical protein